MRRVIDQLERQTAAEDAARRAAKVALAKALQDRRVNHGNHVETIKKRLRDVDDALLALGITE